VAEPTVEVSETTQAGQRELLLRRRQVQHFQFDPLLPAAEQVRDLVEFSEFKDWAEVGAWAEQLFAKSMQGSPALDARAAEIARNAPDAMQRLRLALDFVQREIRYFGTEVGVSSHQPASADTVLRQRFGDCKDKSSLLVALLKRLDIAATPVLVPTYLRAAVAQRLPSPLAFDHAIVQVPLPSGELLWLDGTRSQQTGPPTVRQSRGLGLGLLARSDARELSPLPGTAGELASETEDRFSFPQLSSEGSFRSVSTYFGDTAELMREAKSSMPAAEFERALLGEIARLYPSLVQDGPPQFESLEESNAVRVTLNYRTGNYWRLQEQRGLAGDLTLGGLVAPLRLQSQTPRKEAMRLATPGRHLHRLRFEFGEDLFPTSGKATSFDERNDQFELSLRYSTEPRMQAIEGELRLNADTLAAGQWQRYRETLNRIWPRLATTINLALLNTSQIEALNRKLEALQTGMRSGSVKVATREQARARSRLAVLDEQLAAGRLPEKPRALVLLDRGIQLDHLGQAPLAQKAFEAALMADGDNAELHAALATNALLRRQDQEAISHAGRALALSPSNVGARYTRAWARYASGNPAGARDELADILRSSSAEVDRSYGAIWLYLAQRRAGDDRATARAAIQRWQPQASTPAWPYPVLRLLRGEIDLDQAVAATREAGKPDAGRECELFYYAGEQALADGEAGTARSLLQKSIATGVIEFTEHALATRALERLVAAR